LAIEEMGQNARQWSAEHPSWKLVASDDALDDTGPGRWVFDVTALLKVDAGRSLPIGWHVTSDSIAGWLAEKLGADELILMKSVGDGDLTVMEATTRGWVDGGFVTFARRLTDAGVRLGWINLRDGLGTTHLLRAV
jgi:hypothetical protein